MKPPKLEQPRRLKIPDTEFYEIDECGFVYKHNKKLSQSYKSGVWYAKIRDTNGKQWQFNSERLAKKLFGGDDISLSREDIERVIGARTIPEYPRYSITSYGAVYCMDPPKRGKNAGQRYLLKDFLNRDHPYVMLYKHDGTRRCMRVSGLVDLVWSY